MKRFLPVFLLVLCVSCDFSNGNDATEPVPSLNIEAKVYTLFDGTFDDTLNAGSVTATVNGYKLDTKGKIEKGVLYIDLLPVPPAWLTPENFEKNLPPGMTVSSTSPNLKGGTLELSFLLNEEDDYPCTLSLSSRSTGEMITVIYSDRDVEIRQSGTAEVEIPAQPGQTVTFTADIVLDIRKGWNFLTDKTIPEFAADGMTLEAMSVTQRVVDKIPETARWYYF